MDLLTLVLFVAGLVLLVAGADVLVRGASKLALSVGLTPLIVGLTVVAFGTSAPELAVAVQAALAGQADLAFGNVVGSNIFNVLFILGLSALVAPLVVSRQLLRLDMPIVVGASITVFAMGLDGVVSRGEGSVLVAGIVAYTAWLVHAARLARREAPRETPGSDPETAEITERPSTGESSGGARGVALSVALVCVGLGLLVVGSNWLVEGAVAMARALGMSELVIGLTIVAAGTSLPEVAASVMATVRGEREIAIGNVIGSCIYNLLAVLGGAALISPVGIAVAPGAATFDALVMVASAVACLLVFFTGMRISRGEGALFLGSYASYVAYLILHASRHPSLPGVEAALVYVALPIAAAVLLGRAGHEVRQRRLARLNRAS